MESCHSVFIWGKTSKQKKTLSFSCSPHSNYVPLEKRGWSSIGTSLSFVHSYVASSRSKKNDMFVSSYVHIYNYLDARILA